MKEILKNIQNELTKRLISMIEEYVHESNAIINTPKEAALYLFRLGYDSFEEAFDTEEEVLEFLEEHNLL